MRCGMTTGLECECIVVAGGCITFGSEWTTGCVAVGVAIGTGTGLSADLVTSRADGEFLAAREPILSDLRGDGGDCCRYGNDLGEYIILATRP
jgi:hypothetical protein